MSRAPRQLGASSRHPSSFADLIRRRADEEGSRTAYTFLADGEEEAAAWSFGGLDAQARAIGARLVGAGLEPGDRALLLFPPGLEFVAAFAGCLCSGVVAVPTYLPRRRTVSRFQALFRDARPGVILTSSAVRGQLESVCDGLPELGGVEWLESDGVDSGDGAGWMPPELSPDALALLQYTSGSTAAPKGVMVSHGNLLHNEEMIRRAFEQSAESVIVGWLPMYHDMGLIGNLLQPLYVGGRCVLMSPMSFLQRPERWLRAISRYRATTSGGPNFAYELAVRKTPATACEGLDLASWRVAFNGAEPIRASTMERFTAAFEPYGFRRRAFYPCYGLAEGTLFVSGSRVHRGPRVGRFAGAALAANRVQPGSDRALVSCGGAWLGQEIVIVDPESRQPVGSGAVGEIWVRGPSVAQGYWGNPEATAQDFRARLEGDEDGAPFLRTGDLGFQADGELYVTGRLKDLVILRGRNHYPQDIEETVEACHEDLRAAGGAAFSVEVDGEERLVVAWELERRPAASVDEVVESIRSAISEVHEIHVHEVVLLRAGTIPKTTSGKIRRHACRQGYLAATLVEVGRGGAPPADAEQPAGDDEVSASLAALGLRREVLLALPEGERHAVLVEALQGELARGAGVPAAAVSPTEPLERWNAAPSLRRVVEERLGVVLEPSSVAGAPDLASFARRALDRLEGRS